MIRFTKTASGALFALSLCTAAAYGQTATLDAPPAGITPAAVSLAQVRALHQRAVAGHLPGSYRLHETLKAEGIQGTLDRIEHGGDYRVDEMLGPVHTAEGIYHGRRWQQNGTGEVATISGVHQRTQIDDAVEATLGAGATLLGEVTDPVHAYVVRIDPPGGRLEYVFYDTVSGHIDRIEAIRAGSREITTYDQYAAVGAATIPWHEHTVDSRTSEERDLRIVTADTSSTVSDGEVAPPAPVDPLAVSSWPSVMPAQFLSDRVILRTRINGHPVDLQLDSGSSGVLIDKSVLDASGIRTFGKGNAVTAGLYAVEEAVVPRIEIGNAALTNVAVEAAPFSEIADNHTVVAGLLGFDLIDTAVVKIDYASAELSLLDPATFTAPPNAVSVPIALDDLVPAIAATIAGASASHMVVDTGADRSTLFSQFIRANPERTKDQGLGERERDAYPFEQQFYGVGGQVSFSQLQLGPLAVAGVTFPTWLFDATENAASFEFEDIDGLIGQDVLRYFDVYLDYPQQRIYFVPNQRYRDRFS